MAFQLGAALTYISNTEGNSKKVRASCTIVQNDIHIINVSIGNGELFSSIPRPPWFACKYNYYHNKCVLSAVHSSISRWYIIYIKTIIQHILCIIVVIIHFFFTIFLGRLLYCISCYYDHQPSRPCRTISGVSLIARFDVFVSCLFTFRISLSNVARGI